MKKIILSILILCCYASYTQAQTSTIIFEVHEAHDDHQHEEHDHDSHDKGEDVLIGAAIEFPELGLGLVTDVDGLATFEDIPYGEYSIRISYTGYRTFETTVRIGELEHSFLVEMKMADEVIKGVVVSATRSTRTIRNIPTRVEYINAEELSEKAIMNASNISLVLRESTGIQIQQTSLSSGNAGIRIQGLDGRFTQLLKDGFPLYGGFSGGLSINQIPPLDLNQFEIIKGSSSTLYGGGAIAGLVNMVSKTPKEEPELDIMLSQTHALGSTANIFYSQRGDKLGWTLYGAGHFQREYDPDGDDFSNLPRTSSISLNPKLFYYPSEDATLWVGFNGTLDTRRGGDMSIINATPNGEHQFFENNYSIRWNTQLTYDHQINENTSFQFKNSVAFFDRELETVGLDFQGRQWNSFSEAALYHNRNQSDWIVGMNVYSNKFDENPTNNLDRSQRDITSGLFVNNTTDFNASLILETGFRLDYAKDWGIFPLPRVSLLWKANDHFSSRFGGGMGYKIPDIFTEDAAVLNYENIMAIDKDLLHAEKSYGFNWDVNYKNTIRDKVTYSINQLFYWTGIQDALLLMPRTDGLFSFENAAGLVTTRGAETNVKFGYEDFRLFLNYAFIDTRLNYLPDNPLKPLTAQHNTGTVLMYENSEWRIGYEVYYTGKQKLTNGNTTNGYAIMGFLFQKHFKWGSPYINFENFTDRRQSRFSPEVIGHQTPVFQEIYAPTDGFIFTAGVVIKPFGNHAGHEH